MRVSRNGRSRLSSPLGEARFRSGRGEVCMVSGPAPTAASAATPESELAVVVAAEAAEAVLYPSDDMKDTGLGSLMVCESEMGESDLEPES